MSVRTPYPPIFDKSVGSNGILSDSHKKKDLDTIPILSGLHSGTCIGDMIESLYKETKRIKRPELNQFVKTGLEMQEMSDCFERLLAFSECYADNYI
ncbi:hypothetical protein FQR65_LT09029 [Abscondita terminalis]|nr:hypothetical protein FQR65_LT09029 [Abscondita terminalis]